MDKYSFKITIGIFMLFRRSHETFLDIYYCYVYVLLYNIPFVIYMSNIENIVHGILWLFYVAETEALSSRLLETYKNSKGR